MLGYLYAAQQIISADYTILQQFSQAASSLPYFEVGVIASNGENTPDKLVRFELGP